jgi:Nif-specific regulatory protein
MPALRERIEDVPDLARFLVTEVARMQGRELNIIDTALRVLMRHDWQGDVQAFRLSRELGELASPFR